MANASSEDGSSNKEEDKSNKEIYNQDEENTRFQCNICLDNANDVVVSICGHLFCWPCLPQWLETVPSRQECPVCKAHISKEKVLPIYGCGNTKQEDPRNKEPPRSNVHRTEFHTEIEMSDIHLVAGNEIYPFGLLTSLPPTVDRRSIFFLFTTGNIILFLLFIWVIYLYVCRVL